MASQFERLRRLSSGDGPSVVEVLAGDAGDGAGRPSVDAAGRPQTRLDARTVALVRIAALVALDGPGASFDGAISDAVAAGASLDDVVETMIAVGPTVGSALLVSAAAKVAMAIGYDIADDMPE